MVMYLCPQVQSWIEEFQSGEPVPEPVEDVCIIGSDTGDAGITPAVAVEEEHATCSELDSGLVAGGSNNLNNNKCVGVDFRTGYLDINNLHDPDHLTELTGCLDQKQFNLLMAMFEPEYKRQRAGERSKRFSPNNLSFANKLFMTLTKLKHNMT